MSGTRPGQASLPGPLRQNWSRSDARTRAASARPSHRVLRWHGIPGHRGGKPSDQEPRDSSALTERRRGWPDSPPAADIFRSVRSKDEVREEVWKAMEREGVSRFPGAEGRIPNFAGAKLAAEKLAGHRLWRRAEVIKANPDSPQTYARRIALEEGKTVIMAVPRLRDPHPFRVLDPKELSKKAVKEAATIKGALRHGRVIAARRPPRDRLRSLRLGRRQPQWSAGRQRRRLPDLEYGMLIDAGKIDGHTTVATTVHPTQILRQHLMMTAHDLPST